MTLFVKPAVPGNRSLPRLVLFSDGCDFDDVAIDLLQQMSGGADIMNSKSQLSLSGTGEMLGRVPIQSLCGHPPTSANLENTELVKSILIYDSKIESVPSADHSPRSVILGLVLAFGFSAIFWAVLALLIARVW